MVYLLLAGCLFAELGYGQVWHRLAAGLDGLAVAVPTASAMTQARRRLGPGPLRELFSLLRGPSPGGARWRGLLVGAIDGTIMTVADSEANLAVYSKQRGGANGGSSYPMLRLLALVSCGTRTVIDAVFGPVSDGETTYAPGLLRQPARGHDPAGRPELRRRVPGRADRGDQGGLPDPRPDRVRRPGASGPAPPARRVLAVALRRRPRPGHRRRRSPSPPAPGTPPAAAGWSPP